MKKLRKGDPGYIAQVESMYSDKDYNEVDGIYIVY